jgi:CheY-like chemotaxis protein
MEEKKTLEILVVDDDPKHQAAAERLREAGHNVTVAKTFLEALGLLGVFIQKYSGPQDGPRCYKPEMAYDMMLTDLMFPLGGEMCDFILLTEEKGEEEGRYKPEPLGYALALHAARVGVPYVGIVTDSHHHAGPVAATFDLFGKQGYNKSKPRPVFDLGRTKMMLFDKGGYDGCDLNRLDAEGKDWASVLNELISKDSTQ